MDQDNDLTNEPQEYAVSINALVKADSFMELKKRVTSLQSFLQQALRSDPNSDGYYIGVDDIWSNIKPPILEDSSDGESVDSSKDVGIAW